MTQKRPKRRNCQDDQNGQNDQNCQVKWSGPQVVRTFRVVPVRPQPGSQAVFEMSQFEQRVTRGSGTALGGELRTVRRRAAGFRSPRSAPALTSPNVVVRKTLITLATGCLADPVEADAVPVKLPQVPLDNKRRDGALKQASTEKGNRPQPPTEPAITAADEPGWRDDERERFNKALDGVEIPEDADAADD
eukprot:6909391-Prymnesium_polylepis.1